MLINQYFGKKSAFCIFLFGLVVALLSSVVLSGMGHVRAYQIPGRPGLNINQDASGNTTVSRPGSDITVGTDGTTIDVNGNTRSVTTNPDGSVQIQSSDASGRTVNLDLKTSQDIDAYESVIIQQMPAIVDIEVGKNTIEVEYKQPGKFLGIFNSSLNGTVIISNDGSVEIDLPWYSFLYRKNVRAVERAVEAQLQAGAANGTVNFSLVGTGAETNATITVRNSVQVIDIVSSTVSTQVRTSPSTPIPPPPAGTSTPAAQSGTTSASFIGLWSGRFSPNSIAAAAGCRGGSVSFTVKPDGTLQGPVQIDGSNAVFYGGGRVDNSGNMSGGWSVSGSGAIQQGTVNLSGKLMASGSGSGSWSVPGGCLGSFSVTRQ